MPRVNDTLLLAAAIVLAACIGLGMVALRPGRSKGSRVAAWILAQAVFHYIVAVAVTRNPLVLSGA